jgi:hypothetical protein
MAESVKCDGCTAASNTAGAGSTPATDARSHINVNGVRFLYTNADDEWDAIRAVIGGVYPLNKVAAVRVLRFAIQVVEARKDLHQGMPSEPNGAA